MKKRRENKYNFVKLFLIVIPLNASDAATKKYHIVQEDIKFSNSKNIFENIPKLIGEGSFKVKNKIAKFLYDITRLHKKNNHKILLYNILKTTLNKQYNIDSNNIEKLKKAIEKYNRKYSSDLYSDVYSKSTCVARQKKILNSLKLEGFFDAKIKTHVVLQNNSAYITHNITEGTRYRVSSVKYKIHNNEIKKIQQLRKDEITDIPFSFNKLSKEKEKIYKLITERGFLEFRKDYIQIYIFLDKKKKTAKINIEILDNDNDPVKALHYGKIDFLIKHDSDKKKQNLNDIVFSYILKKKMTYKAGDLYRKSLNDALTRSLLSTNSFKNVYIKNTINNDKIDSKIILIPRNKFKGSVNPYIGERDEGFFFQFGGNINIRNLFKSLEEFKINSYIDFLFLSNNELKIKNLKFTINPKISYNHSLIFNSKKIKTNFDMHVKWFTPESNHDFEADEDDKKEKKLWSFMFKHQYKVDNKKNYINITPFVFSFFKEKLSKNRFLTVSSSLSISNNDKKILNKKKITHYFTSCELGFTRKIGVSKNWYIKNNVTLSSEYQLARNIKISYQLQIGGILNTPSDNRYLPEDVYFHIGGSKSMRGWKYKELGSSNGKKRGKLLIILNGEIRHKLSSVTEIASFIDIGNIWFNEMDEESYLSPKTIAADFGIGIRIVIFANIVLRIDYGIPIYNPIDRSFFNFKNCVHITIGYPF